MNPYPDLCIKRTQDNEPWWPMITIESPASRWSIWISVTNSEPSNTYSTKSSHYPYRQRVPHVDCLDTVLIFKNIHYINLTMASRLQHETTLVWVPEVISNILCLVCTRLFSFVIHADWNMTCDMVSYMVSYMNSYMDCDIISRHFLWHERFMNGSERFRTVQNSFECWNKPLLRACWICLNLLRINFCDAKILLAGSCGRAAASQCRGTDVRSMSLHTFIK